MMNVQCDKNNFYSCVVSRGNLDLLLNGLGDLMTKHSRGKTKVLLSSCLPLLCLCLMSKPRESSASYSRQASSWGQLTKKPALPWNQM